MSVPKPTAKPPDSLAHGPTAAPTGERLLPWHVPEERAAAFRAGTCDTCAWGATTHSTSPTCCLPTQRSVTWVLVVSAHQTPGTRVTLGTRGRRMRPPPPPPPAHQGDASTAGACAMLRRAGLGARRRDPHTARTPVQ